MFFTDVPSKGYEDPVEAIPTGPPEGQEMPESAKQTNSTRRPMISVAECLAMRSVWVDSRRVRRGCHRAVRRVLLHGPPYGLSRRQSVRFHHSRRFTECGCRGVCRRRNSGTTSRRAGSQQGIPGHDVRVKRRGCHRCTSMGRTPAAPIINRPRLPSSAGFRHTRFGGFTDRT